MINLEYALERRKEHSLSNILKNIKDLKAEMESTHSIDNLILF